MVPPRASPPAHPSIYLAFDFGTVRIGVAVGNTLTRSGRALQTLSVTKRAERWLAIEKLVAEWQPDKLLVGRPVHPDGAPHALTALAEKFARQLRQRFQKPVELVDERYTSVCAQSQVATGQTLDAEAARLLIEQYFHEEHHHS